MGEQNTGIKNADELIERAREAGLTVTVKAKQDDGYSSYVVRIGYVVQDYAKGTALEHSVSGDYLVMGWSRSDRKGARGKLRVATWRQLMGSKELRTLKAASAHVDHMIREQKRQRAEQAERDAAAVVAAERDAVTTMFAPGERVRVAPQSWDGFSRKYVAQPEFIGTVVRYHRNGQFIVREPEHGTTSHYSATGKVELFKLESGGEQPVTFVESGSKGLSAGEVSDAISRRAMVRVDESHGWAAGRTGIAMGRTEVAGTVRVGFVDESGEYTGDFTRVPPSALSLVVEGAPVVVEEQPAEGAEHYVTVNDGERISNALGPYLTEAEARANTGRVREFLDANDRNADAYEYGTFRVRGYGRKLGAGKLNARIGLTAPAEAVSAPVSDGERPGGELVPVDAAGPCEGVQGAPSGLLDDEERARVEAERVLPVGERLEVRTVRGHDVRESVEDRAFVVGVVAACLRARAAWSATVRELVLRSDGETTLVRAVVPLGG